MAQQITSAEDRIAQAAKRQRLSFFGVLVAVLGAPLFAADDVFWFVGVLVGCLCAAIAAFYGRKLSSYAFELAMSLRAAEERVLFDARHDPLTGLPNRAHLVEYLDVTINHADRHNHRVGLCLIDLHGLKRVNEAYGVETGDAALKRFADFIRRGTRKGDFVARVGSDEFMIVSALTYDAADLEIMASRLSRGIRKPFDLAGATLEFGSASGVVLSEAGALDPHRLINDASIALRCAKENGRVCAVFKPPMREAFDATRRLRSELAQALERGEVKPWFQPQIKADASKTVIGFEALARWDHPERGVLGPVAFFNLAEEFGLMEKIDEVILDASLDALVEWRASGLRAPQIAVNVSALRLRDPFLTERIKWALESRDLEPGDLCIEVLESVLIEGEDDDTAKNIDALSRIGVCVDLDDFGTGHASIATLRRLKVDRVKIDRSFISRIDADLGQQRVARTMVELAHSLNVEALAEGVETKGEFEMLSELSCDAAQGFFIAKPMDKHAIAKWLTARGDLKSEDRKTA